MSFAEHVTGGSLPAVFGSPITAAETKNRWFLGAAMYFGLDLEIIHLLTYNSNGSPTRSLAERSQK